MEAMLGPFATCAPGLGYLDYLAELDQDHEMWRQIVPNQTGRGLALGRWGLQNYEEYAEMPDAACDGDNPLWVPILVEWASLTTLEGFQIRPDSWYLEQFHTEDAMGGEDALPMVGICSATATWPALSGPWSVHTPDGLWGGEALEGPIGLTGGIEMVMPIQHVLPIEDDQVLAAVQWSISEIERLWPLDHCGPTYLDDEYGFIGEEIGTAREWALQDGHSEDCFENDNSYGLSTNSLRCSWGWQNGTCLPCGGGPHITAVVDSFLEAQPHERFFDPLLIPSWDRLKERNFRFYDNLLEIQETERSRGRSWYYSYLQRWSPWGHSSQVPVQRLES